MFVIKHGSLKMKETRYILGKEWKQKKNKGNYEKYYLEFKDEIDKELTPPKPDTPKPETKPQRKK